MDGSSSGSDVWSGSGGSRGSRSVHGRDEQEVVAYNNFIGNNFLPNNNPGQTKNNWSGALDVGNTLLAVAPFATRGSRTAMFGEEARAQTLFTANRAITGAKNLPNQALNAADSVLYGAKVLATELSPPVVTPEGLMVRPPMPEAPTPRPMIPGPQKQQPMMMQGNPEGPQGTGTSGKGTTSRSEPSSSKLKSLDELRVVSSERVGDFRDISGKSVQEVISRIPEGATMRKLTPVEGGSTVGVEYKWVDEHGVTNRLRLHDADPSAPVGSNASQGWVARYQVGGKYYDPEVGNLRPRNVHKPESPHYDPKAANDTHIPIETPSENIVDLMRF